MTSSLLMSTAVHLPPNETFRALPWQPAQSRRSRGTEKHHLPLLPSGPDGVHGFSLRRTQTSSPLTPGSPTRSTLGQEFDPALADCGLQGAATPPSSTTKPVSLTWFIITHFAGYAKTANFHVYREQGLISGRPALLQRQPGLLPAGDSFSTTNGKHPEPRKPCRYYILWCAQGELNPQPTRSEVCRSIQLSYGRPRTQANFSPASTRFPVECR